MDEQPNRVYDPDSEEPITRPDLHALEGGGETTEPRRGHLQAVDDSEEKSASPESLKGQRRVALQGIKDSASSQENSQSRGGLYSGGDTGRFGKLVPIIFRGKNLKRTLAGGGIISGIIAIFIFVFLTLLPPKD